MKNVFALLVAVALPVAAYAQPDLEPLTLNPDSKLLCNPQADWCVGIKTDGSFETNGPFATSRTLRADRSFWDLPDIPDFSKFTVWPQLIRMSEDRALVGVVGPAEPDYKLETQFSGGSFSRKDLYLFEVGLGEQTASNLVFIMPMSTEATIRSCFNEADQKKRDGHCIDAYRFKADLKALAGTKTASGVEYPDLQVTTQATRAPANASRYADSSAQPAPTQAQVTPAADKQCSYQVTYKWKSEDSVYAPAAPLPDCAEFLQAAPTAKP